MHRNVVLMPPASPHGAMIALDFPPDADVPEAAISVLATEPRWRAALLELPRQQRDTVMAQTADAVASVVAQHGGEPLDQLTSPCTLWKFRTAERAVTAAMALRALPSPAPVNLELAQAVHTVRLDADGQLPEAALVQCRHACEAGNPAQILVTASTATVIDEALGDGHHLRPLGRHRMRDLSSVVELFDLSDDATAPARPISLDTLPNNLPGQSTTFVGRQDELREVLRLLGQHRLLTITGPGGGGKTRLALHAAAAAAPQWPDGVWWVDLGTVDDSGRVLPAVATAAGLSLEPAVELDGLSRQLRDRQMLIVLDTCEHLLDACAELATHLARTCPSITILATSREPLGVPGEMRWILPPLTLEEATRLFLDRASLVVGGRAVDRAQTDDPRAVVQRLDGIPLAIELAAGWVRTLTTSQIAAGLDGQLELLATTSPLVVPRQQTLTASMQWSHNLLDDAERIFFRRLAVFSGTFDIDAAAAVCAERHRALWRIGSLVDKSLIVARPVGGEIRYRLLDTVRQYAATQLVAARETESCRDRHLDHYLAVAEAARLPLEMDQDRQRSRLAADRANLQAALNWGLTRADPEQGRRLAAALARFWFITGDAHQGLATLQRAIARAPEEESRLQARLWTGLAMLGMISGRFPTSEHAADRGKALAAQCGDDVSLARCLAMDAYRWFPFDFTRSRDLACAAGEAAERADDPFARDWAFVQQAYTFTDQDHHDAAVPLARQALAQSRPRGDRFTASYARAVELWSEMTAGRLAAAVEIGRDAVDLAAPAGDFFALGTHTLQLAMVLGLTGELEQAQRLIKPVARAFETTPDVDMVGLMVVAGNLHLWAGDLEPAVAWLSRGVNFAAPQVDNWAATRATPGMAKALRLLDRTSDARAVVDRGLRLARSFDGATILAQALDEQAHLTVADDPTAAEHLHHEALAIRIERSLRLYLPDSLDALAGCAARAGDYRDAGRLLAASDVARQQLGYPRPPVDRAAHEALCSAIDSELSEEAVAAATAEGATLTLDQAVAYARRGRGPRDRNARGWTGLSPTELAVARHVARGLTNRDIAAQMLVSLSTVKTHLTHIFIKLDVTNRTELTRVVLEHDQPLD